MARLVAEAMPTAIRTVEQRLQRPFANTPRIFVCATMQSFDAYGGRGRSGFVFARRLFISPKSSNSSDRIPGLITHELAHLHVQQRRNLLARLVVAPDPRWFTEGIAVFASGGFGGEPVTEQQAWEAIASGRHFRAIEPEILGQSMDYRQSGMFITFLKRVDEVRFKTFMFAAEDGRDVESALKMAYGTGISELWRRFADEAAKHVGN